MMDREWVQPPGMTAVVLNDVRVALVTLEEGAQIPAEGDPPEVHDFEERIIVLSGSVRVTANNIERLLGAGAVAQSVPISAGVPHSVKNRAAAEAVYFSIMSYPPAPPDDGFAAVLAKAEANLASGCRSLIVPSDLSFRVMTTLRAKGWAVDVGRADFPRAQELNFGGLKAVGQ